MSGPVAGLRAGVLYFAVVFLAGFALGTLRVLAIAPRIGEAPAVLLEAPLMLAISWLACGWVVRRLGTPAGLAARAAMGASAFALLMLAELAVSVLVFGRSLAAHFAGYLTSSGLIGLLAQCSFAAIPIARGRALGV